MSEIASLEFERAGSVLVVRAEGELDLANVDDLQRVIKQHVAGDVSAVVIDLSRVGFLDSSGVEMLFRLQDALEMRQIDLALVIPRGALIRRAIEIADRTGTLAVSEERDAAIAHVTGQVHD